MPRTPKINFSVKRDNPYIQIGKFNVFLLIKDRRYGSGLVAEWGDKVRTLPTNLFAIDDDARLYA